MTRDCHLDINSWIHYITLHYTPYQFHLQCKHFWRYIGRRGCTFCPPIRPKNAKKISGRIGSKLYRIQCFSTVCKLCCHGRYHTVRNHTVHLQLIVYSFAKHRHERLLRVKSLWEYASLAQARITSLSSCGCELTM